VCAGSDRFKQVDADKKTQQLVQDLWEGIDSKCKNVDVKDCQVMLNTDSALNNKMSVFVNAQTQKQDY